MKITKKVIAKYTTKSCNQEENTAIKKWIASTNDEESYLSKIELIDIKAEMWKTIRHSTEVEQPKIIPLYKKLIPFTAAACAVFGLLSAFITNQNTFPFFNTEMAFDNTTDVKKEYQNAGMNFTLMPNSKVNVSSRLGKSKISFCGNMKIQNKTKSKINTAFTNTCGSNSELEISLNKNKTYYALTIKYKEDEKLYVLNKSQMENLPKHLAVRALSLAGKI